MRPIMRPMTRSFLLSSALALCATPLWAERFEATAPVRTVTLYPWGANITRLAEVAAPAGAHEIVIPGMPQDMDPASLRIAADGATVGAVSLQEARALPADGAKTPAIVEAEAEVHRLENALRERDARTAAIRARAAAAEDSQRFLLALAQSEGLGSADLVETMRIVREQMLEARQTMIAAETEAAASEQGREDDEAALSRARARLDALRAPDGPERALVVAVESAGEPFILEITGFSQDASWQPVYDLRLDREAGRLSLDRNLMVTQSSGEDWQDVALTLSTARPSDQSAPSRLDPWFPRLSDPVEVPQMTASRQMAAAPVAEMAADASGGIAGAAVARMMGATVVYDYPTPVTIRSGVDALRLKLDSRDLAPEIRAEAVPARDSSAYLVAETANSLDEVILPGEATLYADGAMVGRHHLDLIPAGEEFDLGFGPIDGLVAEYEVPEQAEGGRGIISRSSSSTQTALLRVRNLTGQEWPLRVIGQVPVATQDDLKIAWSADPRPSAENPDGERGILHWDATIAPQEVREITLRTEMNWPEGKVLTGMR